MTALGPSNSSKAQHQVAGDEETTRRGKLRLKGSVFFSVVGGPLFFSGQRLGRQLTSHELPQTEPLVVFPGTVLRCADLRATGFESFFVCDVKNALGTTASENMKILPFLITAQLT